MYFIIYHILIAFFSQVRENILFGSKFEHERYRKVIDITALQHDLNLLPVR